MKCALKTCGKVIPKTRKRSAKYCSNECYYEAKKDRSAFRYASLKAPADELNRCERILAYLLSVSDLGKSIGPQDLEMMKFNFAISSGEYLDDKKRLFKVIGRHAYFIESNNKSLIIWKSK